MKYQAKKKKQHIFFILKVYLNKLEILKSHNFDFLLFIPDKEKASSNNSHFFYRII